MTSGIYQIRNIMNQHVYYGSAKNIRTRWKCHKSLLKKEKHHSKHLQQAWCKYGADKFEWKVIEECEPIKKALIAREQHWLDTVRIKDEKGVLGEINQKVSYNVCPIARSCLGIKHSEETKRKLREIHKGCIFSETHRKHLSEALTGKKLSEETKKRISEAQLAEKHHYFGKHFSEEHRRKISEANKGERNYNFGKHHSEEHKEKMKKLLSGENGPRAILTWDQVKEIREKHEIRYCSSRKLAKEYKVGRTTILHILQNESWQDFNYQPRKKESVIPKLTFEQIRKIRELYSTGNYKQFQLALEFSVANSTISNILNFKVHKEVITKENV